MGGGKKRGRARNKKGEDGEKKNEWKHPRKEGAGDAKSGWTDYNLNNDKYVEYYKGLGILPEDEVEAFVTTMRKPLPITFRINGSGKYAEHMKVRHLNDLNFTRAHCL
eukprot:1186570-Prorocentrum_minimum.AAC.5